MPPCLRPDSKAGIPTRPARNRRELLRGSAAPNLALEAFRHPPLPTDALTREYYHGDTFSVTKRIAVSLPDDLFDGLERVRRRRRVARSALVQEAVDDYMRRTDEAALEEAYFDGYRRIPDGADRDFTAIERVGIEDLKKANVD